MFGLEFGPMSFEEDQGQECVVDVVVWLASTQPLTAGTRRNARREGTFDKGNVVAQRIGVGITQEVRQSGVTADHGKDLNRLTQLAAGDASLPSSTNSIAEFYHRNTIVEAVREIRRCIPCGAEPSSDALQIQRTAPASLSCTIASAATPNSFNTSSVCSPRRGA